MRSRPPTAPVADRPPAPRGDLIPAIDITVSQARSINFNVAGVSESECAKIAAAAEQHRKDLAQLWLGKELDKWPKPCPVQAKIDHAGCASATTFQFSKEFSIGGMSLSGTREQIFASLLPHEVTHTVLADHFRKPVPRWADEGAAIMAESPTEQTRHVQAMAGLLKEGRAMRLSHLFKLTEYPNDVMTLYAQGYTVTRFLVERKDRATFLAFVKAGSKGNWDAAAHESYGFENVNELEYQWLEWMRKVSRELPQETIPSTSDPKSSFAAPSDAVPLPAQPPPPTVSEPQSPISAPTLPPQAPQANPPQPAPAMVHPEPTGSGPTIVQAALDDDGNIVCLFSKMREVQPMTTSVRDKSGNLQTVTSYVRTSRQVERIYRLDHVEITGTDGKPLDAKEVAKRLKKETAVLFVYGGSIDPQWLALLKEGTLIMTSRVPIPAPSAPPPVRK
jgi:hypothetical protein